MTEQDRLLDAALIHVAFDGWSEATLRAAAADCDIPYPEAKAAFPRGPVDMVLAYHRRGDARMTEALRDADLSELRFRDRIAKAVRTRLELSDKEAVRRGMALLSLPQNASDAAKALWGTVDLIWSTLGDSSQDINWYTKRATLSAVYSSTVLYWLGDESAGQEATWAFLDRRIDNVMQFEKVKAQSRENPLVKAFMRGPGQLLDRVRAPGTGRPGYPGHWSGR